eukprot:c11921_g1_i1.p1 GENE.c11921_g1_i1~~c11921_g1_i1.p1  ORF type:complete len:327 (-),score=60.76 c11921_g1_i1:460-1440(-)
MPLWWLGFFFDLVVAGVLTAISLSLADQMVLAPLSGLTLVFNAALSAACIGEKLTRPKVMATLLIILGTSITTVTGIQNASANPTFEYLTLERLSKYAIQPTGLAFLIIFNIFITFLHFFLKFDPRVRDPTFIEAPDIVIYPIYVPLAYSTLAGMAAAQQQLCLKSISGLVFSRNITATNPFTTPYPYLILIIGILMGLIQIVYVNEGMKRFHNTLFIPVYNAAFISFNILSGMLFFEEVKAFSLYAITLFVLGALLALVGQLNLLWGEQGGKEVMIEAVKHRRVSIVNNDESVLQEIRSHSRAPPPHPQTTLTVPQSHYSPLTDD